MADIMKVVIVNKSDSTGGAAVVSRRLMEALRASGIDAQMLVVEKLTDSPCVHKAAGKWRAKIPFFVERLKIFAGIRFKRRNLFKVDTASDGLPLWRHPLVKEADVVCLNWVNQGMLSLRGVRKILEMGKPVVWTMHDMWNMTGICHHSQGCIGYSVTCGDCFLIKYPGNPDDLSHRIWKKKQSINKDWKIQYVAVSNWLADMARKSWLLKDCDLHVVPNPFFLRYDLNLLRAEADSRRTDGKFRIVMGAARLDDPIKGLPILVEATRSLRDRYPEEAARMVLLTFGNVRRPDALVGIGISHTHLGMIRGEENVRDIYLGADAVVSTSLYETLPGTLVEGMAYGCVPVSFDRGGQPDITDHLHTGYIAHWSNDRKEAADRIADGLVWAMRHAGERMRGLMLESVRSRFAAEVVAARYIALFEELTR